MLFETKKKVNQTNSNDILPQSKSATCTSYKQIIEKLLQINASHHSIALGCAIGFGIAITPLFGLQIILTVLLCLLFRANIPASLISSVIGNPLTFPFIWTANYKLGELFFTNNTFNNTSFLQKLEGVVYAFENLDWNIIYNNSISIILPMLIGGTIMAIFFGIIIYFLTLNLLKKYKNN